MVMFYPAEGCRCGHCHAAPPAGAYPEGPDYAGGRPFALGFKVGLAAATARASGPQGPLRGSCPGRRPAPRVRLRLRGLPYHRCATRRLAGPVCRGDVVGVNYDGPSFGLGKLDDRRVFWSLIYLADIGILKVEGDTSLGWMDLSIAVEDLLSVVPQARKNHPRRLWYDLSH